MRGIEQRLSNLEQMSKPVCMPIVFSEVWARGDGDSKLSSDYIISRCEASCSDKERCRRALEDAFISVTHTNPFEKQGVTFIIIDSQVALEVVRNLEKQG